MTKSSLTHIPDNLVGKIVFPSLLLIFLLLLFGGDLLAPGVLGSTYWDTDISYYIKLRQYAFAQQDTFPQWNSLSMCGVPLVAEIQSGLYYPPNLLFFFISVSRAINISIFIHVYCLALFTYAYALKIGMSRLGAAVSAVAMSLSAPVVLAIFAGHLSNIHTITWIPLALLCIVSRLKTKKIRWIFFLALVLALQILAGHIQYFYYSALLYIGFFCYELLQSVKARDFGRIGRETLFFGGALLLAGMLCLPQLVPVFEMISFGTRASLSFEDVSQFAFPLKNLITLILPEFFGNMDGVPYWGAYNMWEMCVYIGVLPLLLSAVAVFNGRPRKDVAFFSAAGGIALLVSIGNATPFLELMYKTLPGIGMFRGHSKCAVIMVFCLAMLSGIGFDALRSTNKKGRPWIEYFGLLLGLFAILLLLAAHATPIFENLVKAILKAVEQDPRRYLPTPSFMDSNFLASVVALVKRAVNRFSLWLLGGMILILLLRLKKHSQVASFGILGIVCCDLFLFASAYIFTVDPNAWDLNEAVKRFLQQDKGVYRAAVLSRNDPHYGSLSGMQVITCDYPYVTERYSRFFNLINHGQAFSSYKIDGIARLLPLHGLLNLKYIVSDTDFGPRFNGYEKVYDDGEFYIYKNQHCLERVFLTNNPIWFDHERLAFNAAFDPKTLSGEQLVLEAGRKDRPRKDERPPISSHGDHDTVKLLEYKSDYVEIAVESDTPAWMCVLDSFYPGWRATVDDNIRVGIYRANYLFRAVPVPSGKHKVTFRYRASHTTISRIASLTALIMIFTGIVVDYKRP